MSVAIWKQQEKAVGFFDGKDAGFAARMTTGRSRLFLQEGEGICWHL